MVREELVQVVGYELDDPRLAGVVVTDVRMSANLREARIFVMFAGVGEAESAAGMRALNHAAPYVRRQLASALSLRHAPQLFFIRDTVEERAARVDALLQEISHDGGGGPAPAPPEAGEAAAAERGERRDEG